MTSINLIKRYKNSIVTPAFELFRSKLIGVKGIRPELCPAIRDFHSVGWKIASPINIKFYNSRNFLVNSHFNDAGEKILVPGVIGDLQSKRLYARVDTGFSLKNIPFPLLAIKCQSESEYYDKFELAPVIYPKSYTGPILMAISANEEIELQKNEFILHVIPLNENNVVLTIEEDYDLVESNFEGLFINDWEKKYSKLFSSTSEEILRT